MCVFHLICDILLMDMWQTANNLLMFFMGEIRKMDVASPLPPTAQYG